MPDPQARRHLGFLSFTGTGHLTPLLALAQELKHHGHRITFFEKPKIRNRVCAAGFEFISIGDSSSEKSSAMGPDEAWSEISRLRFNLERISADIAFYMRETPDVIRRCGVDALIVNEIALTGPTVAQMLGLPYFLVSTSVPHRFGWGIFPWVFGYRYARSRLSWLEGACLEVSALRMHGPLRRTVDLHRKQLGFGPANEILDEYPPAAHITQLPPCLGQLRESLPAHYYDVGPFVDRSVRPSVPFPWENLDSRPVIYASLGTTRNVQSYVFRLIAEACSELGVQLIVSLGDRFDPAELGGLPGHPILVRYAPQLDLLKIARIVITHGGANTVFEALLEGKPMVVIPLAYDQPEMAWRLTRLHVAEALPVMRLSSRRIRNAITRVLDDESYQEAAAQLQAIISRLRGVERAAAIIESSLRNRDSIDTAKDEQYFSCPLAANLD